MFYVPALAWLCIGVQQASLCSGRPIFLFQIEQEWLSWALDVSPSLVPPGRFHLLGAGVSPPRDSPAVPCGCCLAKYFWLVLSGGRLSGGAAVGSSAGLGPLRVPLHCVSRGQSPAAGGFPALPGCGQGRGVTAAGDRACFFSWCGLAFQPAAGPMQPRVLRRVAGRAGEPPGGSSQLVSVLPGWSSVHRCSLLWSIGAPCCGPRACALPGLCHLRLAELEQMHHSVLVSSFPRPQWRVYGQLEVFDTRCILPVGMVPCCWRGSSAPPRWS